MTTYIIPDTKTLDADILESCWRKFVVRTIRDPARASDILRRPYKFFSGSYRNGLDKKFKDFLWTQGATVIQRDGKFLLQFIDAEYATLFALKWS